MFKDENLKTYDIDVLISELLNQDRDIYNASIKPEEEKISTRNKSNKHFDRFKEIVENQKSQSKFKA